MIFTTKAEYGVRLLIQLGLQGGDQPVSLKAVAEAENLPLAYLERIAETVGAPVGMIGVGPERAATLL